MNVRVRSLPPGVEQPLLRSGTIVIVHNLRNRFVLAEHGLHDVPLMVSIADIASRPYLERSVRNLGLKGHLGVRGPVLVDSGGFSLMTSQDRKVSVERLIELYRVLDADVLAALDVPPALGDTDRVRSRKWRTTLQNLDKMLTRIGDGRLMPVVHGRNLKEVERACLEVRRMTNRPRIVALGGMVPFLRGLMSQDRFNYLRKDRTRGSNAEFVADALAVCRSEFPDSGLHVFGVGSPTTALALLALGADSVDSLAWRRAAGYGTIFLSGCAERIVSSQARQRVSRPTLSRRDRSVLQACGCPVCCRYAGLKGRIGALSQSYIARGVHNVWTLITESDSLRSAKAAGTLNAFLTSRIHGRHRFLRPVMDHLHAAFT